MSTKELAYSIIDGLSEDELSAFVLLFRDRSEPNAETLAAIREADAIAADTSRKRCSSFAEILAEIDDDDAEI